MKTIRVVAAVICDDLNSPSRVFATARGYGEQKGGWEFPGGKIESGETPQAALIREIREELGTVIAVGSRLDTIEYDYPAFHLSMDCFLCIIREGSLELREAQEARWLTRSTLYSVDWLPADRLILGRLHDLLRPKVRKLYPGGRKKAFNITYDDGIEQDERFVALLDAYGIPGTFSLNSELMQTRFEWVHPCGMTIRRLPVNRIAQLYRNHEVASHTLTHPYMTELPRDEILRQMVQDRQNLEAITGRPVLGFAVPFDYYDSTIRDCVREAGFAYGRNSEESRSFRPPQDPLNWSCTLFHLNPELEDFTRRFLECDEELALFQPVGHAYDLDTENMWDAIEELLRRMAADPEILPMTHIDLVQYLNAMNQAQITDTGIRNDSPLPLWFQVDDRIVRVAPGGEYQY